MVMLQSLPNTIKIVGSHILEYDMYTKIYLQGQNMTMALKVNDQGRAVSHIQMTLVNCGSLFNIFGFDEFSLS